MEKIKVLFICHGNICRSTMAESVFTHKVKAFGFADKFVIDSFATSREEIGNGPHHGGQLINCVKLVFRSFLTVRSQMTWKDYEESDYLIGMDEWNIKNINRILGRSGREDLYAFGVLQARTGLLRIPGIPAILMRLMRMLQKGVNRFWNYLHREPFFLSLEASDSVLLSSTFHS